MNKQINCSQLVSGEIHSMLLAVEVVINFTGWCNRVIEDLDGEIFIYKNKRAYNSWNKHGCTTKNNQDMIHIVEDGGDFFLTYGVDNEL